LAREQPLGDGHRLERRRVDDEKLFLDPDRQAGTIAEGVLDHAAQSSRSPPPSGVRRVPDARRSGTLPHQERENYGVWTPSVGACPNVTVTLSVWSPRRICSGSVCPGFFARIARR